MEKGLGTLRYKFMFEIKDPKLARSFAKYPFKDGFMNYQGLTWDFSRI